MRTRLKIIAALLLGLCLGSFAVWVLFAFAEQPTIEAPELELPVNDAPMEARETSYTFSELQDLQNPELPTGCEATALSTLLRMNGVDVSKTEVADAMPKGEDFVTQFWGDPYSEHGWACMAPCVMYTARRFCPVEKTPVDLTGTQLLYVPAPSVVWVTMGLEEAIPSEYESDGRTLLWNTHAVTLVAAGEGSVRCIDPLVGLVDYPFSTFNRAYMANGCQAVYIADRGYEPIN